ncbi:unnamed protein product [Sphagnum balticum]
MCPLDVCERKQPGREKEEESEKKMDHVGERAITTQSSTKDRSINEMLTSDLFDRIVRYLEDARHIAIVGCVCKPFYVATKNVNSIRYVCREQDYEYARRKTTIANNTPGLESVKGDASEVHLEDNKGILRNVATTLGRGADDTEIDDREHDSDSGKLIADIGSDIIGTSDQGSDGKGIDELFDGVAVAGNQGEASSSQLNIVRVKPGSDSSYQKGDNSKLILGHLNTSSSSKLVKSLQQGLFTTFRRAVEQDLQTKLHILQLRIEIEPKLQSKSVGADEREQSDFWLSDPGHLYNWVPSVAHSLQHLCIVDYGHQAIGRVSPILKILSHYCKHLKTIDLRNMCIDTNECIEMSELTSFTLRCVKINGDALNDFSDKMKNLQTLALLGVFGIGAGHLVLQQLKVLCLGLSTKAKVVTMELPSLTKLQLKMACPDEMSITAPNLKYVAFNLEVSASLALRFVDVKIMQELLYGASKFVALSDLVRGNLFLNKVFLDIPCMALGEDGKWLGVLKEVALNIPSFTTLQQECPNLKILNVGPGLWYSMESNIEIVKNVQRWPRIETLILQMIPQKKNTSVMLLKALLTAMNDTLVNLEIFVHTSSPVNSGEFFEVIQDQVRHLNLKQRPWTKSLDFSCFTF